MRLQILSCISCISWFALAAIITERNDVNCRPPPAYTFVGDSSHPGIESCWIPYGTYTDGMGDTEYSRVTSNLMGVVASALGGAAERAVEANYGFERYYNTLLRPLALPNSSYWSDGGEYLDSATNTSLRIADQINKDILYFTGEPGSDCYYRLYPESIEPLLARTQSYDDEYTYNGGVAGRFGSRCLDDLVHAVDPPISTAWTSRIPFNTNDVQQWVNVWPTYAACTNDIHFFPGTNHYRHVIPDISDYGGTYDLWGLDVVNARDELYNALTNIPLSVTLEDVLSVDTGWEYELHPVCTGDWWTVSGPIGNYDLRDHSAAAADMPRWDNGSYATNYHVEIVFTKTSNTYALNVAGVTNRYSFSQTVSGDKDSEHLNFGDYHATRTRLWANQDDYAHWRNMTTRLAWKRLGIICQLERQMEITYRVYGEHRDMLPCMTISTNHGLDYDDYLKIELPPIEEATTTNIPLRLLEPDWNLYKETYDATTNSIGWRNPTCRLPAPLSFGSVDVPGGELWQDKELDQSYLEGMLTRFVQDEGFADGDYNLVLYGTWVWTPPATLHFRATLAENWDYVTVLSNTVTATINGKEYSVTGTDPISSRDWSFYDAGDEVGWDFDTQHIAAHGGIVFACTLGAYNYGNFGTYFHTLLPLDTDLVEGSYVAPSVVFTATGGVDYTEWMWQATGIEGTNCVRSIGADSIFWEWEDGSSVLFDDLGYDAWAELDSGAFNIFSNDYPRVISSPSIRLDWQTISNTQWACVWTNDNPSVSGFELTLGYDITNATVHAVLGLVKEARATFTYSYEDAWDDIRSRFANPIIWDNVSLVRHPTLECLLYDSGESSMAYSAQLYDSFAWETIKYHSAAGRLFRMSQFSSDEADSRAGSDYIRLQMLCSLDDACKNQCASLGRADLQDLANFGKLTPEECNSITNGVLDEDIHAQFGIHKTDKVFIIKGDISVSDGVVTVNDCSAGYDSAGSLPTWVCSYGWELRTDDVAATNKSVRADGFQSPVTKTLWKFKNLRDPTL